MLISCQNDNLSIQELDSITQGDRAKNFTIDSLSIETFRKNVVGLSYSLQMELDSGEEILFIPLFTSDKPFSIFKNPDVTILSNWERDSAESYSDLVHLDSVTEFFVVESVRNQYYYVMSVTGSAQQPSIRNVAVKVQIASEGLSYLNFPLGEGSARTRIFVSTLPKTRLANAKIDELSSGEDFQFMDVPEELTPRKTYFLQGLPKNSVARINLSTEKIRPPWWPLLSIFAGVLAFMLVSERIFRRRNLTEEYQEGWRYGEEIATKLYRRQMEQLTLGDAQEHSKEEMRLDIFLRHKAIMSQLGEMRQKEFQLNAGKHNYITSILILILLFLCLAILGANAQSNQKNLAFPVVEDLEIDLIPTMEKNTLKLEAYYKFVFVSNKKNKSAEQVFFLMRGEDNDKIDKNRVTVAPNQAAVTTVPLTNKYQFGVSSEARYKKFMTKAQLIMLWNPATSSVTPSEEASKVTKAPEEQSNHELNLYFTTYHFRDLTMRRAKFLGMNVHHFPWDKHEVEIPIHFKQATNIYRIELTKIEKFDNQMSVNFDADDRDEDLNTIMLLNNKAIKRFDAENPCVVKIQLKRHGIVKIIFWLVLGICFVTNLVSLFFANAWKVTGLGVNAFGVAVYAVLTQTYYPAGVPHFLQLEGTFNWFDLMIAASFVVSALFFVGHLIVIKMKQRRKPDDSKYI